MLAAGVRIADVLGRHFVSAKIEAVNHDNVVDFSPCQLADCNQVVIDRMIFGQY